MPPTWLTSTPSQIGVMSAIKRLPPIVLVLIAQGIAVARSVAVAVPSDPISVTFPLTVIPFSSTAFANQAKMFPLTVMLEFPAVSDGSPFEVLARMSCRACHQRIVGFRSGSPGREAIPDRP